MMDWDEGLESYMQTYGKVMAFLESMNGETTIEQVYVLVFYLARLNDQDLGPIKVKLKEHFGRKLRLGDLEKAIKEAKKTLDDQQAAFVKPDHLSPAPSPHLTDLGNAERFVTQHGADLHYVTRWGKWLVWDGTRWAEDDTELVLRKARETVQAIWKEILTVEETETRVAITKHAAKSEHAARLMAMVELARSDEAIVLHHTALDSNPWLLNCRNGTLDLRTGELRPHHKADLLTKCCPVDYDPQAKSPLWEQFLDRILDGNQELIAFLQRAVGYSLTGTTGEECLFFLYGTGRNGKSKFLCAIEYILGDYAKSTRPETLMEKYRETIPNDIAALMGARFVPTIETGEGKRLAESLVKQMTGGDTLSARFLRQEYFNFTPEYKIWLAANHKPVIHGTDNAIWERIHTIPFTVTIPEAERDKALGEKLQAEGTAILAWAVQGCLAWQRDGLKPPQMVRQATQDYRAEMDELASFTAECCTELSELRTQASTLYKAYQAWGGTLSQQLFSRKLQEKGYMRKRSGAQGQVFWHGIGLLAPEREEKNAPF